MVNTKQPLRKKQTCETKITCYHKSITCENIGFQCECMVIVRVQLCNIAAVQHWANMLGALILQTLEEAKSTCSPDVSVRPVRASGLLTKFQDPTTLLGLNIAQLSCPVGARVIEPITSISQDDSSWHVLEAARAVKSQLQEMRQDGKFNELLIQVERQVMELDL